MGGLSLDAQGDYLEEFLAAMDESLLEFAMLQEVPQLGGPRPPPFLQPAAKRARAVDKPTKKEIPDLPTPHIFAKQYDTHTLVQAWHDCEWRSTAVVMKNVTETGRRNKLISYGGTVSMTWAKWKHGDLGELGVVSVHLPHWTDQRQADKLISLWDESMTRGNLHQLHRLVLGGDLNETLTMGEGPTFYSHTARGELLCTWLAKWNLYPLEDDWNVPTHFPYSDMAPRRLDYIFGAWRGEWQGGPVSESRHRVRSDHDAVEVTVTYRARTTTSTPTTARQRTRIHQKDADDILDQHPPPQPEQGALVKAVAEIATLITQPVTKFPGFTESDHLKKLRAAAKRQRGDGARTLWKEAKLRHVMNRKDAAAHADTPAAAQVEQNEGPRTEKERQDRGEPAQEQTRTQQVEDAHAQQQSPAEAVEAAEEAEQQPEQEEEDPDDIIDNFLDHIDLMQRDHRPPQQQQGATEDQEMDQLREDEQEETRRREMLEEEIRRWELEEEEEQRLAEIQYDEYLEGRHEETAEQARTQHAADLLPNGTIPTDEDPDSEPGRGCHPADVIAHHAGDPEERPQGGDLYDFVHLALTRWRRLSDTASTAVALDTDGIRELANTIHAWRGPHLVDNDSNTTEAATSHEHLLNLVGQILSRKTEHEDQVTVLTQDTLETLETILEAYHQKRKWGTTFRKQNNARSTRRTGPPRDKANRASASTDPYHHEHLDYKTWTTRTRTIYPEGTATEPPTRTPAVDKGPNVVTVVSAIVENEPEEEEEGDPRLRDQEASEERERSEAESSGSSRPTDRWEATPSPTRTAGTRSWSIWGPPPQSRQPLQPVQEQEREDGEEDEEQEAHESAGQQSAERRRPNHTENEQHHVEPPHSTKADAGEEEYDQHHDEPADSPTDEPEEEYDQRHDEPADSPTDEPEEDLESSRRETRKQRSTRHKPETTTTPDDREEEKVAGEKPRRGPHYNDHEQHHDELTDSTKADAEKEHDHEKLAYDQTDGDQHGPGTATNRDNREGGNTDQEERLGATRRGPHYSEHEQHHDALADSTEADVEEEHDHEELAHDQTDGDQHEPETATNLDDTVGGNADQEEPQRRGQKRKRQAAQPPRNPSTPGREEATTTETRGPPAEGGGEQATPAGQPQDGDHDGQRGEEPQEGPDSEERKLDPKQSEK